MYGNGVRTGMDITAAVHRPIQQDHLLALAAFFVAAAGTSAPGTVECRFVTTAIPTTGSTAAVSASSCRNYNNIHHFVLSKGDRAALWSRAGT